jgi:prepilin-type N-terminal cleavage/methylation domain-containing protein
MEPLPLLGDTRAPQLSRRAPAGFTVVEMLVVLSIIVVITVVAVSGQGTFNRSLLLTDTAYTIAFSIREAQTLGLSSRVFSTVQNAGYGIRFSRSSPKSYTEYADIFPAKPGDTQGGSCPGHSIRTASSLDARPGNCQYDSTELVRTYTLSRGFYVGTMCGTEANGTQRCTPNDFDHLDISFMRPSTNAVILGRKVGVSCCTSFTTATIYLNSPDGAAQRCIVVTQVGQVAVKACP